MRRPLSVALVAIVVLFCASCAPFGGGSGLNPEQKADLARARSLESIEVFGRDVEPTIIHARNELLTRENYRTSRMNDHISQYDVGDQTPRYCPSASISGRRNVKGRAARPTRPWSGRASATASPFTSWLRGPGSPLSTTTRATCAAMARPLTPKRWRISPAGCPTGSPRWNRGPRAAEPSHGSPS